MKTNCLKLWLGALVLSSAVFCPTLKIGADSAKSDKTEDRDGNKDRDKDNDRNRDRDKDKDKDKDKDRDKDKDKDDDKDKDKDKVTICHKGHTLRIPRPALRAHLNHGDTLGSCVITPSQNR